VIGNGHWRCAAVVLGLIASCWFVNGLRAAPPQPEIRKSDSGKAVHYLMMFELTRDNTVFPGVDPDVSATPGASFTLRDGGQFEVEIMKSAFPVSAPACKTRLILRMPWTNSEAPQGKVAIADKEALFARLDKLRQRQLGAVPVAIDLSPYVKATAAPPGVELTACNIFFRDVGGRYVDMIDDFKR